MLSFLSPDATDKSQEIAHVIEGLRKKTTPEDLVRLRSLLGSDLTFCERFCAVWAYWFRVLDAKIAEDVLQGAYLRFHRRLLNFKTKSFESRSHAETVGYFVRRFVNCIRDEARQQRRHSMLCSETLDETLAGNDDNANGRLQLRELAAELPEQERQVLTAAFFHGHSLSEIGRSMGLPPSRISRIRRQGLVRLRGQLGDDFGFNTSA